MADSSTIREWCKNNLATCIACEHSQIGPTQKAEKGVCGLDGRVLGTHVFSGYCPILLLQPRVPDTTTPTNKPYWQLWQEFHTQRNPTSDWLNYFISEVWCGNCRENLKDAIRRNPCPFDSRFFFWTVDRHNEVNSFLGKKVWSYTEAANRWADV